jgi:predicted secreted hydrolase
MAIAPTAQAPRWKEATPGRTIVLPADHASHPEYKLEWWYYTGNLEAEGNRRFGYQLTFFRIGVERSAANRSRWAVRDLFMAHLALTDVNGRRHRFAERVNRAGPGWAGASTDVYRVWNEDWLAGLMGGPDVTRDNRPESRLDPAPPPIHVLRATHDGFGIDLRLTEDRPPALHGDRGYSRKGSDPGNASHYYSLTRMPTVGSITLDGRRMDVSGSSWMDHEFGTTFLEAEQVGWDWFAIQLDDGRDLMVFQVRRADGSVDPRSSGTLVAADGRTLPIAATEGLRLEPGRAWTSPASGARYPVEWTVRVPASALNLAVRAAVDAQELKTDESTGVTYWEGAIDVAGQAGGRPVTGRGYLEMTGYAGVPLGSVMR